MSLDKSFITTHFVRIPVPGLGDCFYETLRLYGTLYYIPSLQKSIPNLRKTVYDEMMRRRHTPMYQIVLAGLTNNDLSMIKQKQQYLDEANIAAVQLAYEIFGVNIIFYNSDRHGFRIDRYPEQIDPDRSTIHILRVDDIHFDLLIPNGDPIQQMGFADQIRKMRQLIKNTEIKRNEVFARSIERNQHNQMFNRLGDELTHLQQNEEQTIRQAAEIMRIPEYQLISKEVSYELYQTIVRIITTMANEKYAKQLAKQELNQARMESNAEFARRIAEEELRSVSKRNGGLRKTRKRTSQITRKLIKKNRK